MKCVIQRVKSCKVEIEGKAHSMINQGLLVLYGVEKGDEEGSIKWLADKVCNLRIFQDENGKMSRSVLDIDGEIMIVSQFTLAGKLFKGRRPDFTDAMKPDTAKLFYDKFIEECRKIMGDSKVKTGVFGAMMDIHLINQGPVTLILEHPIKK